MEGPWVPHRAGPGKSPGVYHFFFFLVTVLGKGARPTAGQTEQFTCRRLIHCFPPKGRGDPGDGCPASCAQLRAGCGGGTRRLLGRRPGRAQRREQRREPWPGAGLGLISGDFPGPRLGPGKMGKYTVCVATGHSLCAGSLNHVRLWLVGEHGEAPLGWLLPPRPGRVSAAGTRGGGGGRGPQGGAEGALRPRTLRL